MEARAVPIEAELKARVRDVDTVRAALGAKAKSTTATYRDTYFDRAAEGFMDSGRELRLRTVETSESVKHVLTFKMPAIDEASGSKPEFETTVGDVGAATEILLGMGYSESIALTKRCENFAMSRDGREVLVTLATVPELDGTFIEVEAIVSSADDFDEGLQVVRELLEELGIPEGDLTTELYTDAVSRARRLA